MTRPRIVVIGGGAGGLELATRLGNKLGRKGKAHITLVDRNHTHIWKPLLHEVATGTLDVEIDQLSYRAHAAAHGFDFQLGSFSDLKRQQQKVVLAPVYADDGEEVLAARRVNNDRRITVYASLNDKALAVSRALHGYPRLGSPYCFNPFEAADLKAKGVLVTTVDKAAFAKATSAVDDKWLATPIGPYLKKVIEAAR